MRGTLQMRENRAFLGEEAEVKELVSQDRRWEEAE